MREFEFLSRVFASNRLLPDRVLVPPGDDMAVIDLGGGRRILFAADGVIEGRHAPWGCDGFTLGRKAVLRNVSDVAAMGNAVPVAIVATATMPRGVDPERAWRVFEGLRDTGAAWGAPLVGGDLARTSLDDPGAPIEVSVSIIASPRDESRGFALRSDARPGDGVFVTGLVGGAWDRASGGGRHLDFTPRLAAAHALVDALGPRLGAMIDVSDGLGRDLGHIADMSGASIEIALDRVPVAGRIDPLEAIGHGEDYELAFTARGEVPESIAGVAVTRIGVVTAGAPRVVAGLGGRWIDVSAAGFEHSDERGSGAP